MKIVNHKTLTSAFFALCALMFSVAVSGGCGGGGSGNSVSQDTITLPEGFSAEYASPDVTLSDPEGPVSSDDLFASGDEYGNNEINEFSLLTKTTWRIEDITIRRSDLQQEQQVRPGNKYNTDTVTFLMSGNSRIYSMGWAKADAKKTPIADDLTVLFKDTEGYWQTAPILRPANNFVATEGYHAYGASVPANSQSGIGAGTEEITLVYFLTTKMTPPSLTVENKFRDANGYSYTCVTDLGRVEALLKLDQTDWQIKNMQVFGLVKGADGKYTAGDPQNYVITNNSYMNNKPITLLTSLKNNDRFFEYTVNLYNYTQKNVTLLTSFRDKTLNQELAAPYLRAGGGFQPHEKSQGAFEVIEGRFQDSNFPGNEIVYVSGYGPNAEIIIDNSVCYYDKNNEAYHYWVRTTLTPYNPNN